MNCSWVERISDWIINLLKVIFDSIFRLYLKLIGMTIGGLTPIGSLFDLAADVLRIISFFSLVLIGFIGLAWAAHRIVLLAHFACDVVEDILHDAGRLHRRIVGGNRDLPPAHSFRNRNDCLGKFMGWDDDHWFGNNRRYLSVT